MRETVVYNPNQFKQLPVQDFFNALKSNQLMSVKRLTLTDYLTLTDIL